MEAWRRWLPAMGAVASMTHVDDRVGLWRPGACRNLLGVLLSRTTPLRVSGMAQPAHTTNQFRYLAQIRLSEAYVLLKAAKWHGAMYLAGYVLECALKAVIAKYEGGELPHQFEVHDLDTLRLAIAKKVSAADLVVLNSVPAWTHLQRYSCTTPRPATVVRFIECVTGAHRCLQTYL
jgi:HEPN domain-containing protein